MSEGLAALAPEDPLALEAPNLVPPPGNPRFPLFDSLRAIAALSVFLGHTVSETYTFSQHRHLLLAAIQAAYQGVAIFFLISGFLLYRPFVAARRGGRPVTLGQFALRRALRIVPAYWAALTIFVLAGLLSGITVHNFWRFYGFAQVYAVSTISRGIGAAWTLCIEVTFYAALPLFALAAARLARDRRSLVPDVVLLVALAVGSLAFRVHYSSAADFATVSTLPGTFFWFALGMGLAVASVAHEARPQPLRIARLVGDRPDACWIAAILASVLLYELPHIARGVGADVAGFALYGVVALFVLLPGAFGDERGGVARRVLRVRALAWIGLVSYAFYLYHTIVIAQVSKHVHGPARYPLVLVLSAAITTCCAALSYYLLERPAMRLRFTARRAAPKRTAPGGSLPSR